MAHRNGVEKLVFSNVQFLTCICCAVLSHSVVSDSVTPWTVALQAPLSVELSRQEYWSGLPFSSPGDLPDPGVESGSPVLQTRISALIFIICFLLTLGLGFLCIVP